LLPHARVWERRREGVCSLGYDPRPTPSLLRVGIKLSDPGRLKTDEPLIITQYFRPTGLQGVAGNKKGEFEVEAQFLSNVYTKNG
jgi:hypothetical protein